VTVTTGIVDAHHHLWDLDVRDQPWTHGLPEIHRSFHAADLEPLARAAGVVRSVLVQTVVVADETPEMLAVAEDSPLIAGVVGWVDLTAPDVAERIAALRAGRGGAFLRGIRHQVQGERDGDWLIRPDVLRGLDALAEAGLVYDFVVQAHQLPSCVRVARARPEVSFVLDHCGKPAIAAGEIDAWAADIRELGRLANVACKLSGLVTEADHASWKTADLRPYADTVLEAFGPERLMFGSDWPVCTLAAPYERVLASARELTAGLGADEAALVFAGTAARVYGL
jgi:L-fuconolactonase